MKKYLISFFVIGMTQLISPNLSGQTIINYQTWTGATGCNIFSSSTAVSATANGNNITVAHQSNIGQPEYSGGSTNAVSLGCFAVVDANGNTTAYKGTEFRLAYNFQQGYSYEIKINAACINGNSANLRILPNSGGSGTSTQCNGPADIDPNTSGNLYSNKVMSGGTTWTDYTYNYGTFSSAQTLLNISAVPPIGSGTQTILIRKITITGIPPTASFTITPASVPITCGSTTPITLTINNGGGTTGITNYTWNLGATPNGWLYNGNPAPASILITSTTLAPLNLTPDCGKALSSVSATVTANAVNYNTSNSSTVSISQPSYSISGASSLCSAGTNYIINGLVCNSSIAWTAPPSNLGTLSNLTASPTTLTYGGTSGNFTLTANVTSCGVATPVTLPVHVGAYTSSDYTMTGGNSSTQPLYWCPNQVYSFSVSGVASGSNYVWTIPTGWTLGQGSPPPNVKVLRAPSSSSPPTGTVSVTFTEPCGNTISKSFFTAYSPSACNGTDPRFTYSPNPAPSYIYVSVASGYTSTVSIKRIQIVGVSTSITVFDQTYGTGVLNAYITTSGFQTGNYYLRIYDGSVWAVYQFIR